MIGKLFASVPVSSSKYVYDLLDMKLLMYLPFCTLMEPGIFVTASDDVEPFLIEEEDFNRIKLELAKKDKKDEPFLCALAHPSTLQVYIIFPKYLAT